MRDIYDDVQDIITDYLNMEFFKVSDLENKIRENGSPMRVAPCVTVNDYLDELEMNGTIKFEYKKEKGEYHTYVRYIGDEKKK